MTFENVWTISCPVLLFVVAFMTERHNRAQRRDEVLAERAAVGSWEEVEVSDGEVAEEDAPEGTAW